MQDRTSVLGLDPHNESKALGNRIGTQLQQAALPDRIKVWEALDLYTSFYEKTVPWEPLLEQWGLSDKRNAQFANLSGGQKQRLFICLALLNDPEIVFLDELTTGLDPQSRRATWELVSAIRDQGKTVIVISHFMDEVEELANRVAIIDHGELIALDTPENLIAELSAEAKVHFTTSNGFQAAELSTVEGVTEVIQEGNQVTVSGSGPLLAHVAAALAQHNIAPEDIRVDRADLEDVFLSPHRTDNPKLADYLKEKHHEIIYQTDPDGVKAAIPRTHRRFLHTRVPGDAAGSFRRDLRQ